MADQWYYWHEAEVLGPFSGRLLVDLAAEGKILPTDIVWREGTEQGVAASLVKHLFAAAPAAVTAPAEPSSATDPSATPAAEPITRNDEPAAKPPGEISDAVKEMPQSWFSGAPTARTMRRATAGRGTTLIGQDGTTVKFRMKCTTCGHEDSSYRSLPITRGTTRVSFYCTKCRKNCQVEIQGHVS